MVYAIHALPAFAVQSAFSMAAILLLMKTRPTLFAGFVLWTGFSLGCWADPISFGVDQKISLGDELPRVAAKLDEKAFPVDGGRAGTDQMLATVEALFYFDSGRLWRMTLKPAYQMFHPPRPFAEDWKNFGGNGDRRLGPKIGRQEFLAYLSAWKERAGRAGKREGVDFRIETRSEDLPSGAVEIVMAPWRRLMGTGRMTGDRWLVTFDPIAPGKPLWELTFEADEFSTLRRETKADRAFVPAKPRNGRSLAPEGELGPEVVLADGSTIRFGMGLKEAETKFNVESAEFKEPSVRPGIDRWLATVTALLQFDAGRLTGLKMDPAALAKRQILCFAEDWQNPDPIGELSIERGQSREVFGAYLAAWRKRAMLAGKREGADFWVVEPKGNSGSDEFSITFAPRRVSTLGGTPLGDGWAAAFGNSGSGRFGGLNLLALNLDAYSTAGRPKPGERDPALAGVTLEDGTRLFFGQDKREVERLLGGAAMVKSADGPPVPLGNARSLIKISPTVLTFDGEKLLAFYQTAFESPEPFAETWKNFSPIGDLRVASGMSREKFEQYLVAWEQRSARSGFRRDGGFRIRVRRTETEEVHQILMKPARLSVFGGDWADLWFVSIMASGPASDRRWEVAAITAVCGEYDSRPPPKPAPAQSKENANDQKEVRPQITPPPLKFPSVAPDLPSL